MHARPVVGGVFIKMLSDRDVWKRWAAADRQKVGPWAPLPAKPKMTEVVPTSEKEAQVWRYTHGKAGRRLGEPVFDDTQWKSGPAVFGAGVAGVRTRWKTGDIWIRREMTVPAGNYNDLHFNVFHDEDVEIYVDGTLASSDGSYLTEYEPLEISDAAKKRLTPGAKVLVAAHCHQTLGGQGIDVGLVDLEAK